jgi:hypothetical protein
MRLDRRGGAVSPRDELQMCPKCNARRYHIGPIEAGYRVSRTELFERVWGYWKENTNGFFEQVPMFLYGQPFGDEGFRIRCSSCGFTWLEAVTP